jgi:hypothetical protein
MAIGMVEARASMIAPAGYSSSARSRRIGGGSPAIAHALAGSGPLRRQLTIGFLHEFFALSISHLFNAPVQNGRGTTKRGTSQMARRQTNSCLIDRLLLCFNRFWNE